MLSHSLGSTHTLHAEEVHQEPDEVVYASPQQGENTRVPRDLEVQGVSCGYSIWWSVGWLRYAVASNLSLTGYLCPLGMLPAVVGTCCVLLLVVVTLDMKRYIAPYTARCTLLVAQEDVPSIGACYMHPGVHAQAVLQVQDTIQHTHHV
jgi:hypothetical protein